MVLWLLFFPLDVFSISCWPLLKELEDSNLKSLASNLPSTILQCKATSTTRKYLNRFRRWKQWAMSHRISANPCQMASYLQHLSESKQFKAAEEEAVNCLSWVHTLASLVSPVNDPLVQATLESLKRACARPVQHFLQKCCRRLYKMPGKTID